MNRQQLTLQVSLPEVGEEVEERNCSFVLRPVVAEVEGSLIEQKKLVSHSCLVGEAEEDAQWTLMKCHSPNSKLDHPALQASLIKHRPTHYPPLRGFN